MRIEKTPEESRAQSAAGEVKPAAVQPKFDLPAKAELPPGSGKQTEISEVLQNAEAISETDCPAVLKKLVDAVQKQGSLYVFGEGHDLTGPIGAAIRKAAEI